MRPVVGSVCIAFAALLASGCALSDRTRGNSADFGFRSKDPAGLNGGESPSSGKISFKAPRLKSRSSEDQSDSVNTGGAKQFKPGHYSLDELDTESVAGSTERKSSEAVDWPMEKTRTDQNRIATKDSDGQFPSIDPTRPRVKQVNARSTTEDARNAIELQGLEFDTAPAAADGRPKNPLVEDVTAGTSRETDRLAGNPRNGNAGPEIQPWSDRPTRQPTITRTSGTAPVERSNGISSTEAGQQDPVQKVIGQLPPLPWQSDLEQLIARAEQHLAQAKPEGKGEKQNESLRKQAHLRLLYLMAQRQEDALTAIQGVEPAQQEFWQQMIWAMSNSFDTVQFPDLNERSAQAVPPLSAALRLMREEAALSIKNMTFCRKISYFGNYERFPRNEFTPGYEVLLYTEIENFVSTPTVDGEYRTSLKSLIEITDSKGKVVWTKGFPPTEDFCRNPRRDYFHNYQFHIPEDLPTGTYSLKLTIVDELSHKRVSNSLNFVLK